MMSLRNLCLSIFVILGVVACSNDFELTEPGSDLAIVYGVLSAKDTAQYIRVERAFVDPSTSALVLSKDVNQLYFANARVVLTNTKTNQSFTLTRVDGNLEGYKRDQGAFADAPNYLYKLSSKTHKLKEEDIYKISVFSNENLITEGSTSIIKSYNDLDLLPSASQNLSFVNSFNTTFSWFSPSNSVIHDLKLVFNYVEEKGGVFTPKSITWPIIKNFTKLDPNANANILPVVGSRFYNFIKAEIPVDPNAKRYAKDVDLILTSGGKEILDYITIGQVNLGITSSGEIPVFTNMSNGSLGLFSSKTFLERKKMTLAQPTLDSIRLGIYTKELNFK